MRVIDLRCPSSEDQKNSGRCWIYASLSPIRRDVCMRENLEDFHFSTNYIYFYDQLRKSRTFLEKIQERKETDLSDPEISEMLREPVSSVGQWCYFASLVNEYGLVPLPAMPDTEAAVDGTGLTEMLNRRLRMGAWEIREKQSETEIVMQDIEQILKERLGAPPAHFVWRGQDYTPNSFADTVCRFRPDDYVMLIHHPSDHWPVSRAYHEEENPEERDPFLTVLSTDMTTLKQLTIHQLIEGRQVVVGCDVRHCSSRPDGLLDMAIGPHNGLHKKEAIRYREIKACHVMSIDGVTLDENGFVQSWQVQDSHGSETGTDGHYSMTDAWFDAFVLNVTIRKNLLTKKLLDALSEEPVYMPKSERF